MSHQNFFNVGINITPAVQKGTTIGLQYTPTPLAYMGLNMLMEFSTASAFLNVANPSPRKNITVMAHLDTGASLTSIDHSIAAYLGLVSTGQQQIGTASGFSVVNNYAADIGFIGSQLKGIQNLQISSCQLPHFNLQNCLANPNLPMNFGVLIGRDLMSRWNIIWNGPTSTVFISD